MRRENKKQGEGVLPPGYTQLEYIKSTGSQYIDTCYSIPIGFTSFQFIMDYAREAYTFNHHIFGCSNSQDRQWFNAFSNAQQSYRSQCYVGSSGQICWLNNNNTNRHLVDLLINANHTCSLKEDSTTFSASSWSGDVVSGASMFLFCSSKGSGVSSGKARMRLYSCKMIVDGVEVRNLVPALRNSDSKPGLYDLVGGTFYTNAGTGEFTYA